MIDKKGECLFCGRDYERELSVNAKCPSDDCPSVNEDRAEASAKRHQSALEIITSRTDTNEPQLCTVEQVAAFEEYAEDTLENDGAIPVEFECSLSENDEPTAFGSDACWNAALALGMLVDSELPE